MRTVSNPASHSRATGRFHARLGRFGLAVPREVSDGLAATIPQSVDRDAVMDAAARIVAGLAGRGIDCPKSAALEAIAAYRGARNWATLDASLRKASGGKAPPAAATIEEQEDVLGRLVLAAPDGFAGWIYFHPDDCRPQARRILVTAPADGRSLTVRAVEGYPAEAVVLEELAAPGGRKAAMWEANELAVRWLFQAREPIGDGQAERRAARMLVEAGFWPENTGGGVMLWRKMLGDTACSIAPGADGDPLEVKDGESVYLEFWGEGDSDYSIEPNLAAALEKVRLHGIGAAAKAAPR